MGMMMNTEKTECTLTAGIIGISDSMDESRFSYSIEGGELDGEQTIGDVPPNQSWRWSFGFHP